MRWYPKESLNQWNLGLHHLHVLEPSSCSTAKYLIIANPLRAVLPTLFLFWVPAQPAAVSISLLCSEQMLLGSCWVEEQAGYPFQILLSLRFSVSQSKILATNQCMANTRAAAETHCELRRVRWIASKKRERRIGRRERCTFKAPQTDSSNFLVGGAHYPLLLDSWGTTDTKYSNGKDKLSRQH